VRRKTLAWAVFGYSVRSTAGISLGDSTASIRDVMETFAAFRQPVGVELEPCNGSISSY
jgi:hypothetical protein